MINRCIGCYYHDSKENICTHGSPIFIDDVCTDYQDSEFVMQIKADAIDEVISEIANWNTNSSKKIPYAFARHLEQLLDLIDIGKREAEIKNQSIFKEICDIQFEAIDKMQKVFEEKEGTKSDRK